MFELSIGQQIGIGFLIAVALYVVFSPWLSLTSLSKLDKLGKIADELEKIRIALETMEKK